MSAATADQGQSSAVVVSDNPVLLVGAGPVSSSDLIGACDIATMVVAADGGAATLMDAGILPRAVIGDLDSLTDEVRGQIPEDRVHRIADQDSTDFEKCLTRIAAPLVLAVGFSGGRMDHLLAVLNAMARHPQLRCVLSGPEDIGILLPPALDLLLPEGAAVSLFPLAQVSVQSEGLHWPVAGLPFRPDGQIGTSNRALGPVALTCDGPGMFLFLPRQYLGVLLDALKAAPGW